MSKLGVRLFGIGTAAVFGIFVSGSALVVSAQTEGDIGAVGGGSAPAASKKGSGNLPSRGLIAGTATGGFGSTQLDGPWGAGPGEQGVSPVSGSCYKSDSSTWILRAFNNSEDRYSVSLGMVQLDVRNREIRADTFSVSLSAGQSVERKYGAHPQAVNCAVKLNRWTMTAKRKTSGELAKEIDAKKKELDQLQQELNTDR
jgi:hypothetical protein